ncbi:MAG: hypothetical protein AVDCRST_MAG83-3011 [uncultured Arthrobacter sp.]|uniref:Uncharacterized protein n=1 Tax=uncultured Arthrobacter sp. TaxID=114050 RepID=A0A6J4J458_9MICC|nr:MAG: hypothetical protein AVDCRST_MAG83-3011 [uncultured Arthrobacter sp.]
MTSEGHHPGRVCPSSGSLDFANAGLGPRTIRLNKPSK